MQARHRIILDCDPGVDDAIAILFALACPEIDLLGITCVTGNKDLSFTAQNALRICALVERSDIPVHAGCARPLMGPYLRKWPSVHGTDGLCDLELPGTPGVLAKEHAVDFIIRQVLASPGEISLCVIGPMTNIALAIVKAPEIVLLIRSIVFMGGAAFCPGNSSPLAEFNFLVDPEAAEIVMSSGIPLIMLGLDVTQKVRIREPHISALEQSGTVSAMAIGAMLRAYGSNDPCLHDPCAVLYYIAPELFSGMQAHVQVLSNPPEARGSTVAAVSERHLDGRSPNCLLVTDCEADGLMQVLVDRMSGEVKHALKVGGRGTSRPESGSPHRM
ncbi:nucleoside hydrolase [Rhizobium leguminosarum]|uniref:nucleoside hydrolase n=1 Tax=Rhizobium leguminosarum TaxID=384 RepID=UPI001C9595B6|nr:nucleoside hydrolase [Rhizobium leguminosarum]MBY5761488.1 nucleoside hydrolase [Rhizobium leguminosarum]